jgi:hypothetical protein
MYKSTLVIQLVKRTKYNVVSALNHFITLIGKPRMIDASASRLTALNPIKKICCLCPYNLQSDYMWSLDNLQLVTPEAPHGPIDMWLIHKSLFPMRHRADQLPTDRRLC